MRLLLVVAMDSEAEALRSAAEASSPRTIPGAEIADGRLGTNDVVIVRADIGPVAAAVATAWVLADDRDFDVAISTGIAGAFPGCGLEVGDLVVSSAIVDGDLGMETGEGFEPGARRGWSAGSMRCEPELAEGFGAALPATVTEIITVTRLSAAPERIAELRRNFPTATVEAMEGIGVGYAAASVGVPALEIRAISNLVGPRDTYPWDPDTALANLVAGFARC